MDISKARMFATVVLLLQITLLLICLTEGKPTDVFARSYIPYGCKINPNAEELCQQCATQTRSTIVYPMCCNDQEGAREFCQAYLGYGLP